MSRRDPRQRWAEPGWLALCYGSMRFDQKGRLSVKTHPLEPLSAAEVEAAVSLLKTIPSFSTRTRIISIMLKEPPKDLVHAWPSGPDTDRWASAVLLDNAQNSVSVADLNLTGNAVAGVRP